MDVKNVSEWRTFSPGKPARVSLFESERLFLDVYGLTPGQEQKAHVHEACDKIYYVVEGRGHFRVGSQAREVGPGNAIHVPAGADHSVRNDGEANLTLLVLMAPHPNYVSRPLPGP